MITSYVGLPGSGKSYGVIENVIVPALQAQREVWTNIPCHDDALIEYAGSTVTPFDIRDIQDNPRWFLDVLPKGAICVLDEAWRLWPSGMTAKNVNPAHKEYMAEIRHLVSETGFSSQLVIVTQDLSQLANFARTLIETTYRSVKLSHIGTDKRYRIDVYQGAVTGGSPPKSKLLRQIFGSFDPKIQALYKSHTKSDAGAGNEKKIDGRATIWGNKIFIAIPVGAVLCVWIIWAALGSLRDEYHMNDQQQAASAVTPGAQPKTVTASRKPADDFFTGRETYITLNMGRGGSTVYRFDSVQRTSWVSLDVDQVKRLGYRISVINECLVFFQHQQSGQRFPVTCRSQEGPKKRGFLEETLAGPQSSDGANVESSRQTM